jgi:hypothetical protein
MLLTARLGVRSGCQCLQQTRRYPFRAARQRTRIPIACSGETVFEFNWLSAMRGLRRMKAYSLGGKRRHLNRST